MKIALFLLLYIFSVNTNAQNITFEQLEQFVINNNQTGKANESFNLIIKFIEINKDDKYINYKALILKSYVYKSLFNYTETLKTLDQAYIIGLQSNKISEVKANINLEKAYTFFVFSSFSMLSAFIMKPIFNFIPLSIE